MNIIYFTRKRRLRVKFKESEISLEKTETILTLSDCVKLHSFSSGETRFFAFNCFVCNNLYLRVLNNNNNNSINNERVIITAASQTINASHSIPISVCQASSHIAEPDKTKLNLV